MQLLMLFVTFTALNFANCDDNPVAATTDITGACLDHLRPLQANCDNSTLIALKSKCTDGPDWLTDADCVEVMDYLLKYHWPVSPVLPQTESSLEREMTETTAPSAIGPTMVVTDDIQSGVSDERID